MRIGIGRLLLGLGVAGIVAGLVVAVLGWQLVGALEEPSRRSLAVAAETVDVLDGSLRVTAETIGALDSGLAGTGQAVDELADALGNGDRLLGEAATLTETQLADALASVNAGLPAAEEAAGAADSTLRALARLPFGPAYSPDQPLDEAIAEVGDSLQGIPGRLRDQAALIERAGGALGRAGTQVEGVGEDLATVDEQLDDAAALVRGSSRTVRRVRGLVDAAQDDLDRQVVIARVLVVAAGLALATAQAAPLSLGLAARRQARGMTRGGDLGMEG